MEGITKYSVKPNLARVMFPQTIGLFALGGAFYVLLMANLSFIFEVSAITNYMIVSFLVVLLVAEIIVNYVRNNDVRYDFFNNGVRAKKHRKEESILYNEIAGISLERNWLDRLFRTVTVRLTPEFKIKFIKDQNKVHFNIQKLVERRLGAI